MPMDPPLSEIGMPVNRVGIIYDLPYKYLLPQLGIVVDEH